MKEQTENDLVKANPRGTVKSVRQIFYEAEEKFGKIVKGKRLSSDNTFTIYNEKGKRIEKDSYKSDGNLEYKSIYKYDAKGNKTEKNYYKSDGSLSHKHIYKYDAKGNMIEGNSYESDGSLLNYLQLITLRKNKLNKLKTKIMKKLLLLVAMIVGFAGQAQKFELVESEITEGAKALQGKFIKLNPVMVMEVEGTAAELYLKTQNWLQVAYKQPKKVVKGQVQDKFIKISGSASNLIQINTLGSIDYYDAGYTLTFRFKDGKVRVEISNFEKYIPHQYTLGVRVVGMIKC